MLFFNPLTYLLKYYRSFKARISGEIKFVFLSIEWFCWVALKCYCHQELLVILERSRYQVGGALRWWFIMKKRYLPKPVIPKFSKQAELI